MMNNTIDQCWNLIGVWSAGVPSCDKLREVIHCRNCNVYIRIGRDVFEKEIPPEYISEWTKEYSKLKIEKRKSKESIIIFRLDNEWFGLPTKYLYEIIENRKIQSVPHYSGNVLLGLINVRGQIRLGFSLKNLLGVKAEPDQLNGNNGAIRRNIVIQFEDDSYVFPVDEISGVYRFDKQEYQEIPSTVNENVACSIDGILNLSGKQISCLNPFRVQELIEGALSG